MPDNEHLDANIRKLLAKTSPDLQLPTEARQKALSALYALAARKAPQPPQRRKKTMSFKRLLRYAAVACIGGLLGILVWSLLPSRQQPPSMPPIATDEFRTTPPSEPSPEHPMTVTNAAAPVHTPPAAHDFAAAPSSTSDAEILFRAGDTNGLISLLSDSSLETRLIAANYLAVLGDANAIPAIEAASRIFSGPDWANPYKNALQTLTASRDRPPWDRNDPTTLPAMLAIHVTDSETKAAIPDANVAVTVSDGRSRTIVAQLTTDTSGMCRTIIRDPNHANFGFLVSHRGYVSVESGGFASRYNRSHINTVTLSPALTVGGVVITPDGEPIAGVSIAIEPFLNSVRVLQGRERIITGIDGKWTSDSTVPRTENLTGVRLQCTHPEYVQAEESFPMAESLSQLMQGSLRTRMAKGISLAGHVLDPNGLPLPGAKVAVQAYYPCSQPLNSTTDADGRFILPLCRPGTVTLLASAPRFIANSFTLFADANTADIRISLIAPRIVTGVVLDPQGYPIADANVWQYERNTDWRAAPPVATTDPCGRFEWRSVPSTKSTLYFEKPGFMATTQELSPQTDRCTVTLRKSIGVSGAVTDSATGLPIKAFTATIRSHFGRIAKESTSFAGKDGAYSLRIGRDGDSFSLLITAEGYVNKDVPLSPASQDGHIICDVNIVSTVAAAQARASAARAFKVVRGTTRRQDGSPEPGVAVLLVAVKNSGGFRNGRPFTDSKDGMIAVSDAAGSFSQAVPPGPAVALALSEAGYAQQYIDSAASSVELVLTPLGHVQGVITYNGKPLADEPVKLQTVGGMDPVPAPYDQIPWSITYNATTDSQGRFEVERVVPGKYGVQCTGSNRDSIRVLSGQTTSVQYGAAVDRPVAFRLEMPEGMPAGTEWTNASVTLNAAINYDCSVAADTAAAAVPFPWPAGFASMDFAQALAWHKEWSASAPGAEYKQDLTTARLRLLAGRKATQYETPVYSGGSVRFASVPLGKYVVKVSFYDGPEPALSSSDVRHIIGVGSVELSVPEPPADELGKSLDLGALKLDMLFLSPSHPMPPLKLATFDGKGLDLTSFRGKYLLVNFWPSMFFNLSDENIGSMVAASRRFASDPRISIINVTNHIRPPEPGFFVKFLAQNGLTNPLMVQTDRENARTMEAVMAAGNICSILISPDGDILAVRNSDNTNPGTIESDIAAALAP